MLFKRFFFFKLWLLVLLASFTRLAAAQEITLAADSWCPINCEANSAQPGFMVELAKKIFAEQNIQVKYLQMPWSRAVKMARAGQLDGIIGAFKGDAPDFVFPEQPQARLTNSFYVLTTNTWQYQGVESLKNQILGCIQGYDYGETLNNYIKQHNDNQVIALTGTDDLLPRLINLVESGRVDVIVEVDLIFAYNIAQLNKQQKFKLAGHVSEPMPAFIAFSPNNLSAQHYANILSQGMKRLTKSGELWKLKQKYSIQ